MTIQHEGAHAHPRRVVQLQKRDNLHQFIHVASHNTNGDKIKLNVPLNFVNKAQKDEDDVVETVYSVVYATAGDATSSSSSSVAATTVTQAAATSTSSQNADEAAYASKQSAAQATAAASSSTQSAYPTRQFAPAASSSTSSGVPNPMSTSSSAVAATSAAAATTMLGGTPLHNQGAAATAASSATATQAADSNTGMSGGAKAGVAFAVILALGLLAGLAFFCIRRRKNPKSQEEISNEKLNEKAAFAAPKINRFSADSDRMSTRASQTAATAPRLSLRPVTQFLPNLSDKRQSSSAWERPQNKNPFEDATAVSEKQLDPFAEGDGSDRTNSMTSTNSSDSKTVAAAASRGPNNVHRVQLDFKPSMEDELELISGQLVRMLHEYDDGWALCIRMDRTQQGVVPRTCLSKLPVKPRGPPQNRPQGAPAGRSSPPGPNGMTPTPLTPSRERAGTIESVPGRKPVPGQAL